MTNNIIIAGVGGQGSLLASKLLGALLVNEDYEVKVSEVHGMSQRGGSVVTYVRYGDSVASPVICRGEAHFIVAFERLEAARYAPCLRKGGRIIANVQTIDPMPVITGAASYPDGVLEEIKKKGVLVDEIDALALARQAGSAKAVNLVLLGRLAKYFPYPVEKWENIIESSVKPQFVDINKRAFALGYNT